MCQATRSVRGFRRRTHGSLPSSVAWGSTARIKRSTGARSEGWYLPVRVGCTLRSGGPVPRQRSRARLVAHHRGVAGCEQHWSRPAKQCTSPITGSSPLRDALRCGHRRLRRRFEVRQFQQSWDTFRCMPPVDPLSHVRFYVLVSGNPSRPEPSLRSYASRWGATAHAGAG
jgi:hypothetical protein